MRKYSIAWQEGCMKRGLGSAMGSMLQRAELVSVSHKHKTDTQLRVEQLLKECEIAAATRLHSKA